MTKIYCTHCEKKLNPAKVVCLQLDTRSNEYTSATDVPEEFSQGWFEFGADCAKRVDAAKKS